ncbi:MAG TPA: glycosyltransferase family 9 protein [Candidatus Hydrogenedentes bacterium]|nr:glycosyltransferase family 9 protein [Candidatus Hydrogenedentota bacterium]
MRPRILVVHTGGIGDFLLCCPSIQRMARDAAVELLGRPERLALALDAGLVERIHDLEAAGFDSLFATPSAAIRALLSRFDAAVVWMRDDDGALKRAIQSCGLTDVRTFPGLPPQSWARHAAEYYLHCLGFETSALFRLTLPSVDAPLDVVIHPGSGGKAKNWPFERFLRLSEALRARGREAHWCVGPAEEGISLPKDAKVVCEASLAALARRLAAARDYVGNDSGITHLAAACGTRTTAVFGVTDPRVWAPRGEEVQVVSGTPWPGVDAVLSVLLRE